MGGAEVCHLTPRLLHTDRGAHSFAQIEAVCRGGDVERRDREPLPGVISQRSLALQLHPLSIRQSWLRTSTMLLPDNPPSASMPQLHPRILISAWRRLASFRSLLISDCAEVATQTFALFSSLGNPACLFRAVRSSRA